jgi:hypothetical protein
MNKLLSGEVTGHEDGKKVGPGQKALSDTLKFILYFQIQRVRGGPTLISTREDSGRRILRAKMETGRASEEININNK